MNIYDYFKVTPSDSFQQLSKWDDLIEPLGKAWLWLAPVGESNVSDIEDIAELGANFIIIPDDSIVVGLDKLYSCDSNEVIVDIVQGLSGSKIYQHKINYGVKYFL